MNAAGEPLQHQHSSLSGREESLRAAAPLTGDTGTYRERLGLCVQSEGLQRVTPAVGKHPQRFARKDLLSNKQK